MVALQFTPSSKVVFRTLLLLSLLFQSASSFRRPTFQKNKGRVYWFATAIAMVPLYECASSSVMAGLGDMLFQGKLARESETSVPYNWKRTFTFLLKGFAEGWIWSIWYHHAEIWCKHLTGLVTVSAPKAKLVNTLISLVLDISVACPIIYSLCKNSNFSAWFLLLLSMWWLGFGVAPVSSHATHIFLYIYPCQGTFPSQHW